MFFIQLIHFGKRKVCAEVIQIEYQNEVLGVVPVHQDDKFLPAQDVQKTKEGCPKAISFDNKKQVIAVSKLYNATDREQVYVVWNANTV